MEDDNRQSGSKSHWIFLKGTWSVRMIQWGGGDEYLLMDLPVHFKAW